MNIQEISKKLAEHFPGVSVEVVEGAKNPVGGVIVGDAALVIPADHIQKICETLKKVDSFSFDCLSNLTAVDKKDKFEVVYQLFSYKHLHSVTVKVLLPRDEGAHLPTVDTIWGCANWLEREVYDLFGIRFDGSRDLRRIMLPDDWIGYPLRKDYKEQDDYHGISTTRPSLIQ